MLKILTDKYGWHFAMPITSKISVKCPTLQIWFQISQQDNENVKQIRFNNAEMSSG